MLAGSHAYPTVSKHRRMDRKDGEDVKTEANHCHVDTGRIP